MIPLTWIKSFNQAARPSSSSISLWKTGAFRAISAERSSTNPPCTQTGSNEEQVPEDCVFKVSIHSTPHRLKNKKGQADLPIILSKHILALPAFGINTNWAIGQDTGRCFRTSEALNIFVSCLIKRDQCPPVRALDGCHPQPRSDLRLQFSNSPTYSHLNRCNIPEMVCELL